jgi:hypothetical protein
MARQPGDDWKKAFRVQIAYLSSGQPARAVWEQAQTAAWQCYISTMTLLKETAPANLPNLPLVAFTGHRAVRLGAGTTLIPEFKLLRYVPRPACLPEQDDAPPPPQLSVAAWSEQPQQQSDGAAWGLAMAPAAPPAPRTAGNGDAGVPVQTTTALPATAPPTGGGTIIDDAIPFGACVL